MRTMLPFIAAQVLWPQVGIHAQEAMHPSVFARMNPEDEMNLSNLPPVSFRLGNHKYLLNRKGTLTWKGPGAKVVTSRLQVEKGYCVDSLQAFEDAKTLYVLASVSDWESGGATIQAFNLSTGVRIWSKQFQAFNIGQSTVIGSNWLITGIGAVAKVDLHSGRFLWIHSNLYNNESQAFNSFETPIVESGRVTFTECPPSNASRSSGPFKLTVDWPTGRILENTSH